MCAEHCNYNVCISYSLQGGRSALHYASGVGNYEVVKVLLNNFANVNLLAKVSVNIFIVVRSSRCNVCVLIP